MATDESRYERQAHAFPEERRRSTVLLALNASSSPWTARALAAGGAAMGMRLFFDWHGPDDVASGTHFFKAGFPEMVEAINPGVPYGYLDPLAVNEDLDLLLSGSDCAWLAVILNQPGSALNMLTELGKAGVRLPVLLLLDGPGGIVVLRCKNPGAAEGAAVGLLERPRTVPSGTPELGILAAGVALNEIMSDAGGEELDGVRAIAFSSHHWVRRVARGSETGPLAGIMTGVGTPVGKSASFKGTDIAMIGAGALGNWAALPIALESPRLTIWDGDEVEESNLNRQVFFGTRVGENKAWALAEELGVLNPQGIYEGVDGFVKRAEDLPGLPHVDLAMSLPDNDEARLVCADAAWEAGVLFGTAGSSGAGAQAIVSQPGRACYRCLARIGAKRRNGGRRPRGASCGRVEDDAVVSANMIGAGLLVNELRLALAGRRTANVRFQSTGGVSNRLGRMVSDPPCRHQPAARHLRSRGRAGEKESAAART